MMWRYPYKGDGWVLDWQKGRMIAVFPRRIALTGVLNEERRQFLLSETKTGEIILPPLHYSLPFDN
jgi:hypothetical protein